MQLQSRRDFIRHSLLGSAALSMSAGLLPGCAKTTPQTRTLNEIGLQISTISEPLKQDYVATLRQVAEIGYNTLELGGFMGPSMQEFKALLAELGLNPLSGGTAMAGLQSDLDGIIKESLEMGKKYVICFWPWTDSAENKTVADWEKLAQTLNEIGKKIKDAGLEFAYHNHDLEFKVTEGQMPYDIILENTRPDLVGMEIDLYWMVKGGQQPIPYLQKYPGRFPIWHVKDMDNTPEQFFACVGQGIIDFPAIFAYADKSGMKHVFVEHDKPENPLECIKVSYEYLKQMKY
ncbi:MAG TPA: sugar phosphate isomerase/epimerase [bacterium]|nr:sugar phosphate isomerase/epimerase [bacterium]HPN44619.1 sugar phosphate isomerase/epimerase [bacterium]